jgi:MOSC domain-containing protein YiiM
MRAEATALHLSSTHSLSKEQVDSLTMVAGLGAAGDAHSGALVKHRARVAKDPNQPNLRQVHLIHSELFDELASKGFQVGPGAMGENITTRGIDLLGLPTGAILAVGDEVLLAVTGLRNPCSQLDDLIPGLMSAVLDRAPDGTLIRKAGVMAVVLAGGTIHAGDPIDVAPPPGRPRPLQPV